MIHKYIIQQTHVILYQPTVRNITTCNTTQHNMTKRYIITCYTIQQNILLNNNITHYDKIIHYT